MSNPYLTILQNRRSYIFALAALPARAPSSMYGLGIFTMLSQISTDQSLPIYLSAIFLLGLAVFTPQVGKLVDKFGQNYILQKIVLFHIGATSLFLLSAYLNLANWVLYACVLAMSFLPSVGSLSRARWIYLYQNNAQLTTAFALESMLDEINFLVGSPLAIVLASYLFPSAGVLLAAILFSCGMLVFCYHSESQPPVITAKITAKASFVLWQKSLLLLVTFALLLGITFGVVEIMAVKFAVYKGYSFSAGALILTMYSIGSLASGYLFGILRSSAAVINQFWFWASAKAFLCLLIGFIPNFWFVSILCIFLGITLAPTLTLAIQLISLAVKSTQITEGISWFSSALNLGSATGVVLVGIVASYQQLGIKYGFMINSLMGGLLLFFIFLVVKIMKQQNKSPN